METAATGQPLISVVIVSFNVRDLLADCLDSLQSAIAGIDSEVFVVDNYSDDGSAAMVRERFPSVRLIENHSNAGFAKANNQALTEARGRYLLLLNPDTLVQEDTIRVMVDFFENNPRAGLAGCRIIRPDGSLEPACRRSFPSPWVSLTKLSGLSTLFPKSRLFARYNLTYMDVDASYEVDAVSGSFMMITREAYDRIGGLDEQYFMYGEDLDWCHRVKSAGFGVYYVHSTQIVHFGGQSTSRSSIDADAIFYDAMRLFVRKNLKLSYLSNAFISLGISLRLLATRIRRLVPEVVPMVLDLVLLCGSMIAGELLRFGKMHVLPEYAYPTIYVVPMAVMFGALATGGVYSRKTHSLLRALVSIVTGFLILSSLTFFFKDYAFSRAIVITSGLISLLLIPGWRIVASLLLPQRRTHIATGRPTLIVGISETAPLLLKHVSLYEGATYRILGFVDIDHRRIGENVVGLPIVGSMEYLHKIIPQYRVTDVIFTPDVLSYTQILALISTLSATRVRFKIAPRISTDDRLAEFDRSISGPSFVDVEFNLALPSNKAFKRLFDLVLSGLTMLIMCPLLPLALGKKSHRSVLLHWLSRMPSVFSGRMSMVGYPEGFSPLNDSVYLGKPGLTGLAQLRRLPLDNAADIQHISVQYGRNYSVFLDCEILLRALSRIVVKD